MTAVHLFLGTIFYGSGFGSLLRNAAQDAEQGKASVFGYYVTDPERFGIMAFDENSKVTSVEEKPERPKSNYCITGLYFYDNRVIEFAKAVKPSDRGELEITDINRMYLEADCLKAKILGRGYAWLDTGTMESLLEAGDFIYTIQHRQGVVISSPEEISYINGWIDRDTLMKSAELYGKSPYGQHLKSVADGKIRY